MTSAQRTLVGLHERLIAAPRRDLFSAPDWATAIPAQPGVYVLWQRQSGRPIYVGETANLRARMRDLGRYPNHTCRRKLASSFGLSPHDEEALSARIAATHRLSVLTVDIGRVEFEEYLTVRWAKTLINSRGRRHLARFDWVVPD